MRTVFSNDMVAHVWAQQSQSEGRSANGYFYFRDSTIYSYGGHFPIAQFVTNAKGERAVYLTTGTYSTSTGKHVSYTRRAIPAGFRVICIPLNVRFQGDLPHVVRAQAIEFARDSLAKAKRARTQKGWWLSKAETRIANANAYAEFNGLEWHLSLEALDADYAALQADANAAREARRIAEEERAAKVQAEYELRLADWLKGDIDHLRGGRRGDVRLRVKGDELQTTMGATVPLSHAIRVFHAVKRCRDQGTEWHRNGHTLHVGHFQVDHIRADGSFVAGCHDIAWSEVERIARAIGVYEGDEVTA